MRGQAGLTLLALLVGAPGVACGDQDPPEEYLSTDTTAGLLPLSIGYHAAHDASIRQGNNRATIVKLDDFDPAAPMPDIASGSGMAGAGNVELPPATGMGQALSNVGKAFAANLLRTGPGSAAVAPGAASTAPVGAPGSTVQTTPPATGAPAAAAISAADNEALYTLVERYGAARKSRAFIDLPDLAVSAQRDAALDYYDKLAELNATLANLIGVFDSTVAGTRADVEAQLGKALVAYELSNTAAPAADTATGTLTPIGGGTPLTVTFRRESGFWRIDDPFVPAADNMPKVTTDLDGAVQALNDIDNELIAGTRVDPNRAKEAFTRAVALLGGGT